MLPRHLQSVGRNWLAHLEFPQTFCYSWNFAAWPWWTGNTFWAPFTHVNNLSHPVDWKLNVLRPGRSSFLFQNLRHFRIAQNSWLHITHLNMDFQSEEPKSKRRKFTDEDPSKMDSKPSSPRREDNVVPSPLGASNCEVLPNNEHEESNQAHEGNDSHSKGIVQRHWEDFCHHYKDNTNNLGDQYLHQEQFASTEKFDFSVMSYNILSQDLLEDNAFLYRHCRQPVLFWSFRLPNLLREFREFNADVLCLQEVQAEHYIAQIKPTLEALGYHCEYKMRTGNKSDGCAICFKASKFDLVSANPVEFYRSHIPLLDRDNVGLVLLLRPKLQPDTPTICVANTHLLYNPRRGDIKLTQLAILLAEIAGVALQENGHFCPIILCGDFNSVPGSPLHSFIKEGKLNYAGLTIGKVSGQEFYHSGQRTLSIPIWPESLGISPSCVYEQPQELKTEISGEEDFQKKTSEKSEDQLQPTQIMNSSLQHGFSLSSVYSHFIPETGIPEVTTCHSRTAVTVDYIFYSAANNDVSLPPGTTVQRRGLKLLGRLSLLTAHDLWTVNGLPNETISSDHLSLVARFRLEL
ncbi:protein angel homolog 2 [Ambystoma mexicanum]|uniref:protein angel homolog 2 n=1 Tax=Ambystoma mexicanum TaxID=8296 RepID=UPI0037E82B63